MSEIPKQNSEVAEDFMMDAPITVNLETYIEAITKGRGKSPDDKESECFRESFRKHGFYEKMVVIASLKFYNLIGVVNRFDQKSIKLATQDLKVKILNIQNGFSTTNFPKDEISYYEYCLSELNKGNLVATREVISTETNLGFIRKRLEDQLPPHLATLENEDARNRGQGAVRSTSAQSSHELHKPEANKQYYD